MIITFRKRQNNLLTVLVAFFQILAVSAQARTIQLKAAGGGEVRALIVGINQYAAIRNLKGAVADARDIESTLKRAGVTDLTVLIDKDATRRNMVAAIDRLVALSKTGDLVIISFAGHGAQEPELVRGSEVDGMDEIFVLAGFSTSGPGTTERIIDDELNAWLSRLDKNGVDVLFIADTCHGGGLSRGADLRVGELSYRTAGRISLADDDLKPISTTADAFLSIESLKNVTFLGAVDKFSKSPEVPIPGSTTFRGALSYAVARAIDGGRDEAITREQLFSFARQIVYQYSNTRQTISTEPNTKTAKLDKVVFRLKADGAPDVVDAQQPIRLRIINSGSPLEIAANRTAIRVVGNDERADLVWDVKNGDVVSAFGDLITKCIDPRCVSTIADRTAAIFTVAKLAEIRPQTIRLLPDDERHSLGESVTFHVEGLSKKFLILVNLAGDGTVQLLYPRPEKGDALMLEEQDFNLPLITSEPLGADQVVAVVSDVRLAEIEEAIRGLHNQKAAGIFGEIMKAVRSEARDVRIGMAGSFTGR
ncbi:caspase family protein [Bradyrhizobium sp. AZCC 2289]|uniref:caspase family protein n=1 Tax=Bradyrhizobium sp. AZCC 2289 TaxID=3117026 RepID=UPI002FEF39F4